MPEQNRNSASGRPDRNKQRIRIAVVVLVAVGLFFLSGPMMAQILGIGIMVLYAVAGAAFLFTYLIYNRGFTRDHITPDMLPDTMSEQEKRDFIDSALQRKRKSKWMLVVIFALFIPLAIDFLVLVAVPTLLSPIFGQPTGG